MPHEVTRRAVLGGVGGSVLLAAAPVAAADPSLGAIAAGRGIRFGTAVNGGIAPPRFAAGSGARERLAGTGLRDPRVVDLLLCEARIVVPSNELKMYTIQPTGPGAYDFGPGDATLAFCRSHGLPMRGHTLLWAKDEFLPQWLLGHDFGRNPRLAAEKLLRDYVGTVAGHYGDRLVSWDVVNEALDEKTGEVRANVFTRILGRDTLRIAFDAARERLPTTQLVYNDYMSWGPKDAVHRRGALDLLRWFRVTGVPVDALGIQGHIGGTDDPGGAWAGDWRAFLDRVVAMDYRLLVTEFDVNDKLVAGSIAQRDAAVAGVARRFLDCTLAVPQLGDLLCWGMDDRGSWLQTTSPRPDGLPKRPTPYDEAFRPKPMRAAIAAALAAAPAR
jgi:endo-1,4-beta-xylanase